MNPSTKNYDPKGPIDKNNMDDPRNFPTKNSQMLNKMNDPETGLKAAQSAQNDAMATRMAKDVASSFGKAPPKSIPYMPPYKRINQQSISGPVTKANEENTMSLIHDKKTLSVADAVSKIMEAEKMAKKDHDQDGKIETGKDEYLGSRIRAAKMSGKLKEELKGNQHKIDANKNGKVDAHDFKLLRAKKTMKEEEQIDEAFPTVADGEKSLRAKEGKTSMGTVSKTKTGLVHTRDYEDDSDDTPAKKGRPTGGGAGKSTKKKKLSEMIAAYKEKGIDSLYEEPDNETFTKELKDQKAKFDGKKKGGDVAKPSVQAVKVEQYEEDDGPLSEEQLDEISLKTATSAYVKRMGREDDKSPVKAVKTMDRIAKKHGVRGVARAAKAADKEYGINDKTHNKRKDFVRDVMSNVKEDVEQIDEADIYSIKNKKTGQIYHHSKYPITKNTQKFKQIKSAGGDHEHATIYVNGKPIKEDVEQIDERTLTSGETAKKEDYVKGMKKSLSGFKDRYGDKAKSVMYATATKMAKKD